MSKYLRLFLAWLVVGVFAVYFWLNLDQFSLLLDLRLPLLLVVAVAHIGGVFTNGLFTKFILAPLGKHISVAEGFFVSMISTVGNFFAPVGAGLGFRAVYLKKKHSLPYSQYVSTLYGNYIIVFLVNAFFGLLALSLLRGSPGPQYYVLVGVFGAMFAVSLFLSQVKIPELRKNRVKGGLLSRVAHILHEITKGWNQIVVRRSLVVRLALLTTINFGLNAIMLFAIIRALNLSIGGSELLLLTALGSLSTFINLTPANLGVKEAVYLFSASVIGFSTAEILSIALVDRGVLFGVLLVAWLLQGKRLKS